MSLKADVMWLRYNKEDMHQAMEQLHQTEERLSMLSMDNINIIWHLQYANTYEHIQQANDAWVLKLTQKMAHTHYEMVCHILEQGHST